MVVVYILLGKDFPFCQEIRLNHKILARFFVWWWWIDGGGEWWWMDVHPMRGVPSLSIDSIPLSEKSSSVLVPVVGTCSDHTT